METESNNNKLTKKELSLDIFGVVLMDILALSGVVAVAHTALVNSYAGSDFVGIVIIGVLFILWGALYTSAVIGEARKRFVKYGVE